MRIPDRQIENIRLHNERDACHADRKADAVLLQTVHDAAGRRKAECAAAAQHDCMDHLRGRERIQQTALM